jgi:uncharacterized membrane protein
MQKKWTIILAVLGLTIGLIHPSNTAFGVVMSAAIAFATPWALFFALIGLSVDYFTRKKDKDNK